MKAIISFHSIDASGSVLSYAQDSFAALLSEFESLALPVLTLDELLRHETKRGVSITFDDGMQSVFTAALPALRDHKLPAHLFLTTSSVGAHNKWQGQPAQAPVFEMLNWGQLEQLHDAGFRIECHTHTHPDLRQLNTAAIEEECSTADTAIERAVGRLPKYFAYPYGYQNKQVREYIGGRYKAALTTEMGLLGSVVDIARLPRLDSYYLRGDWIRRNLDGTASRLYLSLRSRLRSIRGTQ
jgi:peptidoglycan/xylan/chitin deacetylase (PgdA/CDA1 family)